MQFATAREAFLEALATAGAPLVLGVGEVHAPLGATARSAASHFTGELLPLLQGRVSDLLLELMMPPRGCADAVAEVREKQAPVTSAHAETAQSEYVEMGDRARALGIVPDLLRPTCADMDAIERAGVDDVVDRSLATIARLTVAQATRLVDGEASRHARDADARDASDARAMVVVYGGALHNDWPPATPARWTYAPALDAHVDGRFVAIDLVVPEFMGDDASANGPNGANGTWTWASLPWWPAYDEARKKGRLVRQKATLLRADRASYVLVFPAESSPP